MTAADNRSSADLLPAYVEEYLWPEKDRPTFSIYIFKIALIEVIFWLAGSDMALGLTLLLAFEGLLKHFLIKRQLHFDRSYHFLV